jgi:subtilisin family serine protease
MRDLALLLSILLLTHCHHSKSSTEGSPVTESFPNPNIMAAPGEHTVLIRDGGFDLNNHVLHGKVGGAYHVHCTETPDGPAATDAIEARQQLIESLQKKDMSCRLVEGMDLVRSSKFDEIEISRLEWNERISSRTSVDSVPLASEIPMVLGGEQTFDYHGTYVASLIAYKNPHVKLVLIADEAIQRGDYKPTCPTAQDLDISTKLYQDADVQSAYISAPSDALTDDIAARTKAHGVTLSNESFGSPSVAGMTHFCPGLDWKPLYEVSAKLQKARAESLAQRGEYGGISVLTLRAAGNEGATINSLADSLSCADGPDELGAGSTTLMVGSYNPQSLAMSAFSDRGSCVLLSAPGEDIVLAAPHNFLFVASGTSFAAPLTTRLASMTFAPGTSPTEMRNQLLALRSDGLALASTSFPSELYYKAPASSAPEAQIGLARATEPLVVADRAASLRQLQRRFFPR